jgi:hypothetical protein
LGDTVNRHTPTLIDF